MSARFASLGTNVITVSPGAASTNGARSAAGTEQTLTLADAQAVAQVDHVADMTPILTTSGQIVYGSQNWNTTVRGVYPSYQTIQSWQIDEGSWFTDQDEQTSAPVAVLGQTVVQNLFTTTGTDPIGETILINNQAFKVVGTLQAKGTQGFANVDDAIFVPYSAANERLKPSPVYVDQIQVQVDDVNNVALVEQNITTLLRTRHHISGPATSASGQQFGAGNPLRGLGGGGGGGGFGGGGNGGGGRGLAEVVVVEVQALVEVAIQLVDNKLEELQLLVVALLREERRKPVTFRCSAETSSSRRLSRIPLNWQSCS